MDLRTLVSTLKENSLDFQVSSLHISHCGSVPLFALDAQHAGCPFVAGASLSSCSGPRPGLHPAQCSSSEGLLDILATLVPCSVLSSTEKFLWIHLILSPLALDCELQPVETSTFLFIPMFPDTRVRQCSHKKLLSKQLNI